MLIAQLVESSQVVLAHQGGWDETLIVLVPLGGFGLLLRTANSRARAAQAARTRTALDSTLPDAPAS